MRLNHRQLEAFRAIMQTGMVTRAADVLNVTQPAISRLLADLEYAVGFALFERAKGRLTPTAEARLLYDEVERSFSGLEKIGRFAEGIRNFEQGSLSVASMPAMALSFLPRVFKRFSETYPKVCFKLLTLSSPEVLETLTTQQVDIGFAVLSVEHAAVRIEPLFEASLCCVLPADHRLAARELLRVEDLEGENFITLGPELGIRMQINRMFEEAGVSRRLVVEAQLSATACAFVREGVGVALVNPVTASQFVSTNLVARRFEPAIPYQYSVIFPSHRPRSRLVDPFLEVLRQALNEGPLIQ